MKVSARLLVSATAVAVIAILRPSHSEVRTITETDATSRCIGDPLTPTCAAETLLACFSRAEQDLCEAAGVARLSLEVPSAPHRTHYILKDVVRLQPGDRSCWSGNRSDGCLIRESGFAVVALMWSLPEGGEGDEPDLWYPASYLVRQVNGRWQVLEWASGDPGGGGLHFRHRDDDGLIGIEDATSDCIGDPVTPECAVETLKACGVRDEPELCRLVGVENAERARERGSAPIIYRIGHVREFVSGDIYCSDFTAADECRIPGHGFAAVYISFRHCRPNDAACRNDPSTVVDERCLTRKADDRWRVVGCEEDYSATLP